MEILGTGAIAPVLNDVSGIPTEGKNLIIVTAVNNVLHFRIFDSDGKMAVDTDEESLTEQAQQIEDLRKQLKSLWPPHEITWSEKNRIITAVTSIVGYNRARGGVVLWDAATRTRRGDPPLDVKEGRVMSVAFSPDGRTIAAGYEVPGNNSGNGGVVLWDMATRTRRGAASLPGNGDVRGVAFSPDGGTIAAGYGLRVGDVGVGGGVVLWDAVNLTCRGDPLRVTEGYVESVAFSPDGGTIAAGYVGGGGDGVVLWDAAARTRLVDAPLRVNKEEGYVESVAFSPDGGTIAAGYGVRVGDPRGSVVLWNVDLQSWKRLAGQIANRNFTRDEWNQYFLGETYRKTFPELPSPPEASSNDTASSQ